MVDKKVINYYLSFYEVSKELDKDQFYDFNMAIFKVMFFDEHIDNITFEDKLLNMLWKSVKHSIHSSIKGYCDKKSIPYDDIFTPPCQPPITPPCDDSSNPPMEERKRKLEKKKEIRKENEKEEILLSYVDDVFLIDLNLVAFKEWIKFKKYNYQKVGITKLVNMLVKYSFDEQQEMVNKSVMNNWSGLFEPKKTFKQSNQASQLTAEDLERFGFNKPSEILSLGATPWTE